MYKFISFLFLLGLFFYGGLGSYALLNNNEGLYAQIAWEMVEDGNWIIPHLNGVPYIEKPPLLYWLTAVSFKVFGKTEFAARFVPATFGFLTCLSLYLFARSLKKEGWGKCSALILGSSCGFIVFSRMVFFDILLTFFLTATALCFYKFYQLKDKKYLYGFSLFLAASLLTKGLVVLVLMGMAILAFLMIERNFGFLRYCFNLRAIGIFLIIVAPWHILASFQEPGFPWFYFVNEHWMRFLDKRVPKDYYTGPFYYYIPRVLAYMIPWTFFAPFLVRKHGALPFEKNLHRFLWCWFLSFFIFFSLSRAKANYYMILGAPPLALYLGAYLEKSAFKKHILIAVWVFVAGLLIGSLFYMNRNESRFSTRDSLNFINKNFPVYLYKRFEELSTMPFYMNQKIPLIDSESRDLWYGEQSKGNKNLFLDSSHTHHPQAMVYVLKRDRDDFLIKYQEKQKKVVYKSPTYEVFYVTNPYNKER